MADQLRQALNILRRKAVLAKMGDSNTNFYGRIKAGLFTSPIKLGERSSGWPEHEVEAILAARIAGVSNERIRELVARLETDRLALADGIDAMLGSPPGGEVIEGEVIRGRLPAPAREIAAAA
jgi:prophage regulatory protein